MTYIVNNDAFKMRYGLAQACSNLLDVTKCIFASLFEENRMYSEKEGNEMLTAATSAVDCATLRRDLCDFRYLKRTRDGSRYWRSA